MKDRSGDHGTTREGMEGGDGRCETGRWEKGGLQHAYVII